LKKKEKTVVEIYEALLELKSKGEEGVLITVVDKENHGPAVVGTKMLVKSDGRSIGTVGGGALEYAAVHHSTQVFDEKAGGLKKYLLGPGNEIIDGEKTGMLCGGTITLFFEYISPGLKLYIFGAGHIGKALAYHLKNLNYFITILDNRPGMAETVEGVNHRITTDYASALHEETPPAGSCFIIATHSHALDCVVLKRIYEADWNPIYIGLIASKRKAPLMKEQLVKDIDRPLNLDILYSPIGLNIGGTSPDEIAISIIAELQAIRYNKTYHNHMRL